MAKRVYNNCQQWIRDNLSDLVEHLELLRDEQNQCFAAHDLDNAHQIGTEIRQTNRAILRILGDAS